MRALANKNRGIGNQTQWRYNWTKSPILCGDMLVNCGKWEVNLTVLSNGGIWYSATLQRDYFAQYQRQCSHECFGFLQKWAIQIQRSNLQWRFYRIGEMDHFQSTGYTPILHPVFKTIIFASYFAISWKQSLCPCPPWSPTDDWIRWTACGPKWPSTKRESAGRVFGISFLWVYAWYCSAKFI